MNKKTKTILSIIVIALVVLSCYFMYGKPAKTFSLSYNSVRKDVQPMIVTIDKNEVWQFSAAVCFASVTNNGRDFYKPLFFTTGSEETTASVSDYNPQTVTIPSGNPSDASISIAETYWSRIELVVIVSNYNDALISAPLASYLNAPLIFKGSNVQNFLDRNDINNVIVVGSGDYDVGLKRLNSRAEIWNYYIERLKENKDECDYIVVTNPNDVNKDVMIPYLSLSSTVLASYRKAIVVTGDYTIEQSWTMQLGYGTGDAGSGERGEDPDTLTDDDEIVLQKNINNKAIKVDNDIDYAVDFLKNKGMDPEYLALVGGPVSLPMLYIKNPIWYEDANSGDNGEEYLATDSYYGDLDIKLDLDKNIEGEYICYNPDKENAAGEYNGSNYEIENDLLYTQELGVGRIISSNLLDTSALLVRGFLYSDTPDTASIVTSKVCGTASFPWNPVGPPRDQQKVFMENGVTAKVWSPTETSGSQKLLQNPAFMSDVYFIIYDGHGYPDGWYYWWMSHHDDEKNTERIGAEDVRELEMKPSIVFSASCLCSALDWPVIWNGSDNEKNGTPDNLFSLGVIHAGALAHIGSTEESWGAFLGGAVSGYGDFDLATIYFDELLSNDLSIGMAHSIARQKYYSQYNSAFDKTCFLENVLYGEPGVNP